MVVGPFAQGIFLMGIIYWYSKGLLNLINDYYRTEFNRKLKTTAVEEKNFALRPQSYDLDDMEELIKMERLNDKMEEEERRRQVIGDIEIIDESCKESCHLDGDIGKRCHLPNRKIEFFKLILHFEDVHIDRKYIYFSLAYNYPICPLNDSVI
ncbi:exit protein of rhodopsin and TRP B [Haematobia irritans]|uniref:exit protein of rhodopsin and TRP B n=1 Tax=Haematobia irritans TaxID=7368 RepID=UPI003F50A87E